MFQVLLQTLRQSESMSTIIRTLRKIHELGSICSQKNLQECSLPKDPNKDQYLQLSYWQYSQVF